ncbi:MAG: MMPL family transporter [Spirochaetales bacterium]|nr:MMPL family transporter [Spirochaetales bacterium]
MFFNKSLETIALDFFENLGEFIIKFKWLLIISILLTGVFFTTGIRNLQTSVSLTNLFLDDDPVVVDQKEFDSIFGNSDFIGILVEAEDVFSEETLALIRDLSNTLTAEMPIISAATSIATFIEEGSDKEESRRNLDIRKSVRGVLYSRDYTQAWILCSLNPYEEDIIGDYQHNDPAYVVGKKAFDIVERYQDRGAVLRATGVPVLLYQKSEDMMSDLIKMISLAALIAIVLIVYILRSLKTIIAAILTISISTGSVFGAMGWLNMTIDSTFMLIPVLLSIAVSIGYTIHIFNFYRRNYLQYRNKNRALVHAVKETGWPILFTAFTTIFALLSFVSVPITAIQWVGVVSAISITIVYLLSMLLFTSILALGENDKSLSKKKALSGSGESGVDRVETWMGKLSDVIMHHGALISVSFFIIMGLSAFGISKLSVDLNRKQMLGDKLPHAVNQNYISESEIGSSNAYNIALIFDGKDSAITPEVLEKVDELTAFINETHFVKRTTSINSLIREVNMLRHRGDESYYSIPEKSSLIRGLVGFTRRSSDRSLKPWINDDNSTLKILVEIYDVSTLQTKNHIDSLEEELKRLFPEDQYPGFRYLLTGSAIQMSIMNQYITIGLIRSVMTALVIISIMMMIVFRNFKLGLIAMIPNITPIIITGGLMGFMGVSLEFVTMTIAPMVMGLAVDDTIHFINHVKQDFNKTGDYMKSIRNSFIKVGKALILANVILCATFAAFLTSAVHSMVNMGIYMIVAMLSALIADFTVTPYIIKLSRPFKERPDSE